MSAGPDVSVGAVLMDAAAPVDPWSDVPAAARRAEDAGLDSLWVGDHLVLGDAPLLDAPMVLAAAVAATTRIDVGTAVFLPSLRPPVWAAKQVATLCHLASPRRVHLGVGLGAGPEAEYRAAGLPGAGRARRTDAFLAALPRLLRGEVAALETDEGRAHEEVRLLPAVAPPTVWVGGSSPAALQRVASCADGWLAAFCTPEQLAASRQELDDRAARAGRARPQVGLVTHAVLQEGPREVALRAAAQVLVSAYGLPEDLARELADGGTPAQVAEQLSAFTAAGVTQVVVISDVGAWARTCDALAEVRRLLRA